MYIFLFIAHVLIVGHWTMNNAYLSFILLNEYCVLYRLSYFNLVLANVIILLSRCGLSTCIKVLID